MSAGPGRRAAPWLVGGGIALAVAVVVAVVLGTRADDAGQSAQPSPSRSAPTKSPTAEPPTDPNNGYWPELEFDPSLPTETFPVEEDQTILVNGLRIEGARAAPIDKVEFALGGEGLRSDYYSGPVGTVIEVPGWGLISVIEREVIETPGRPEVVLHFEVQTSAPLVFTSTFPLETGTLRLTDLLSIYVTDDGAADGIAVLTVSRQPGAEPTDVEGPAGTTFDVPGWGSLMIVEADEDDDGARLRIQTVTDFPVFEE